MLDAPIARPEIISPNSGRQHCKTEVPSSQKGFRSSGDDIQHDILLRYEIGLDPSFGLFLTLLAVEVHKAKGMSLRRDALSKTRSAVSVIIANLLKARTRDPMLYVSVPLGNGRYPQGEHNPDQLGAAPIRRVVHYLEATNPPLVETRGGNFGHERCRGYFTRLRATDTLIGRIEATLKSRTGSTLYDALRAGRGQYIYAPRALPIIRLKKGADEDDESLSNYLALPDSDEIRLMEANLSKYNDFLDDHWLDLIMPDGDFDALLRYNWNSEPRGFGERRRIVDLDLYLNRKLHRVFNNGRIDHGGRFYGGWWQNLPKQFRKCIAINGLPTVEADFSAMQLNMLYALEGLSPPEKSYELEGFPPAERDFLKRS